MVEAREAITGCAVINPPVVVVLLLAPRWRSRLAACARAEAGDGVLEGRRNYCRLLD